MLEVLDDIICSSIMAFTGIYVVGKIISNKEKKILQTLLAVIIFVFASIAMHPVQYSQSYTIVILFINIIIYKILYKITLEQAAVACSIFMVILLASDVFITTILRQFYTQEIIRTDFLVSIMANLAIGVLATEIIDIKFIQNKIRKFYETIKSKKIILNIIFLILLTIAFCNILSNIGRTYINSPISISNLIITIVFIIITVIYIDSKNNYKQLSEEYDTLFTYVQNFEDWIEREQLNRHEYKNQLAVIISLTKDKKVIDKIKDILDDNINIKGDVIHKLKELPKGGLKGLMYYKVAIAQKNKLNIEVDVSIKNKKSFESLTEEQMKTLCKLIGIYFDNAIEAAIETKEKTLSLEVYSIKDNINIVLSNTYKEYKNFSKRNERGVSSKGEGHGNGLYYANRLLSKNKWLESKQEQKDNYYIQILTIKN